MNKRILTFSLLFAASLISSYAKSERPSYRPKLVVGIVVDQMRWDYLERYRDLYGQDGFMRLMREGYCLDHCMVPYLPTVTAVGHACLFTGTYPGLNGIVNNGFYIDERYVTSVDDDTVKPVGTKSSAGKKSPRLLLPTTITDELRMATNFKNKVVGVSLKDRAAILPAGHTANAAYWLESANHPQWITSDYYMAELPRWVQDFNNRHQAEKYMEKGWQWMYPDSVYTHSHPLDSRIECDCNEQIHSTPGGMTLTLDFAKEAIHNEELGADDITDFLTINIASTDAVAHRVGCDSRYAEDIFLQLDRDLGIFLRYLDEHIGKGQYLFFLTADHAGSHNLVWRDDHKLPSQVWDTPIIRNQLDSVAQSMFGTKDTLVRAVSTYQVYPHLPNLRSHGITLQQWNDILLPYLRQRKDVAYAFDFEHIPEYIPEPLRSMAIRGYNPKRSGNIQIIPESGVTEAFRNGPDHLKGASHALWGPDDAHIPLLWMGWSIPHGRSSEPCENVDIAATVANLLHIQMPSACVGKPIQMK